MAWKFLVFVAAELAAIYGVASAVGVLGTLGLLIAGAVLGSWLARREGGRAMRAFVETARSGRPADKEITDGMLVAAGGVLIMIPGFVSDIAGLLALLPPTRAVLRRAWLRRLERRVHDAQVAHANAQRAATMVVDSEVVQDRTASGGGTAHGGGDTAAQRGTVIEGGTA
jgi:UPF0716 protein FxsA